MTDLAELVGHMHDRVVAELRRDPGRVWIGQPHAVVVEEAETYDTHAMRRYPELKVKQYHLVWNCPSWPEPKMEVHFSHIDGGQTERLAFFVEEKIARRGIHYERKDEGPFLWVGEALESGAPVTEQEMRKFYEQLSAQAPLTLWEKAVQLVNLFPVDAYEMAGNYGPQKIQEKPLPFEADMEQGGEWRMDGRNGLLQLILIGGNGQKSYKIEMNLHERGNGFSPTVKICQPIGTEENIKRWYAQRKKDEYTPFFHQFLDTFAHLAGYQWR